LEKFCHLAADGMHQTLLRPEYQIAQDYLKFLDHSLLFERMQKKIDRDYASTLISASISIRTTFYTMPQCMVYRTTGRPK